MSAPQTNIERQKRRHLIPLIGMAAVVIFAVGLIVFWLGEEASDAENPGAATEQVDPTSGDSAAPAPATLPATQAPAAP